MSTWANTTKNTATATNLPKSSTATTLRGGVVRVIDSATGDIARTTSGWIEDEKYGVYAFQVATAWSAEFDTDVTRTGTKTLKLSNTDATGRVVAVIGADTNAGSTWAISSMFKYGIKIKPSTTYIFNCYVKTNNVATNGAYVGMRGYTSAGNVTVNVAASNRLTGTQDWTLCTITFNAGSTTEYVYLQFQNVVAGNISDAWFDINSMTLEEVSTISSPHTSLYYPKFTAVTSTDNIDQSQVVSDNTNRLGTSATQWEAQQFTPTKKNLTGFILRRGTDTGTYTGDVTISIQADSSTAPSGTDLGTPVTILNAAWGAITADTDYTVTYPLTLTIGGTYWIVIKSSTSDDSNYSRLRVQAPGGYTGGVFKNYNGSVWSAALTSGLYFKTLYSKNATNFTVRTDTETVSVTAPTADGWADGTIIDTTDPSYGVTPLTLSVGDNTVYYSSNGFSTADGTVDPSHQGTILPVWLNQKKN